MSICTIQPMPVLWIMISSELHTQETVICNYECVFNLYVCRRGYVFWANLNYHTISRGIGIYIETLSAVTTIISNGITCAGR